jgi:hypothetical protein
MGFMNILLRNKEDRRHCRTLCVAQRNCLASGRGDGGARVCLPGETVTISTADLTLSRQPHL